MTAMPAPDKTPLTPKEHEALGEYVIRRHKLGLDEFPIAELEIAIEAIRAAIACFDGD
jgi:hypothetical protein